MCGCPSSRSIVVRSLVRMVVGVHRAAGLNLLLAAINGRCGRTGGITGVLT